MEKSRKELEHERERAQHYIEQSQRHIAQLDAQLAALPPDPVRLRVEKTGMGNRAVYAGTDVWPDHIMFVDASACARRGLDAAVEAQRYVDAYSNTDPAHSRYLAAQPQYEALSEAAKRWEAIVSRGLIHPHEGPLVSASRALDAALEGGEG